MSIIEWVVLDGKRHAEREARHEPMPPAEHPPISIAGTIDTLPGRNKSEGELMTRPRRRRQAEVTLRKDETIW